MLKTLSVRVEDLQIKPSPRLVETMERELIGAIPH
jgi:hypothetical protein